MVGGKMLQTLKRCAMATMVAMCLLEVAGCRSLESAKNELLWCYSENAVADWRFDRERGDGGYYGVPRSERAIIAHGKAAIPVAEEFMMSFDPRIRCSGLRIISAVIGREAAAGVFVEHLDDPYGPIRWQCWHGLHEMNLLPLESMPDPRRDHLKQWKRLKKTCQGPPGSGRKARP